jgi:hypothetical protein
MRGVASHFNYVTPFDGLVFSVMAGFIIMIAVLNLLLAVALLVQRWPDPSLLGRCVWA